MADITHDIWQTFSETHVFSVMHVFMPAIIYIYLNAFSNQKQSAMVLCNSICI